MALPTALPVNNILLCFPLIPLFDITPERRKDKQETRLNSSSTLSKLTLTFYARCNPMLDLTCLNLATKQQTSVALLQYVCTDCNPTKLGKFPYLIFAWNFCVKVSWGSWQPTKIWWLPYTDILVYIHTLTYVWHTLHKLLLFIINHSTTHCDKSFYVSWKSLTAKQKLKVL